MGKRYNITKHRNEEQRVCKQCGTTYWVDVNKDYPTCRKCFELPGSKYKSKDGNWYIKLSSSDPYYKDCPAFVFGKGWMREARYIISQFLARSLDPHEFVLYADGNKDNLEFNNLILSKKNRR